MKSPRCGILSMTCCYDAGKLGQAVIAYDEF